MWISEKIDIDVQRNAVTPIGIAVYDIDNNKVDLAEYTISCKVSRAEGEAVIATIPASELDLLNGKFNIVINGSAFSGVAGATERITLAYNILATDSGGKSYVIMRGSIILTPGV